MKHYNILLSSSCIFVILSFMLIYSSVKYRLPDTGIKADSLIAQINETEREVTKKEFINLIEKQKQLEKLLKKKEASFAKFIIVTASIFIGLSVFQIVLILIKQNIDKRPKQINPL